LGEHRKTSFTAGVAGFSSARRSKGEARSRAQRHFDDCAPCTRAHNAYMPKVGGVMTIASRPRAQ
jgi:hypothetical protein